MYSLLRSINLWCTTHWSSEDHIFIGGAPRSGTTLLKAILEGHPMICGPSYESTGIFSNINIHNDNGLERTGLHPEYVRTILSNAENIVEFYDRVAKEVCADKEKTLVDKNPWPPRGYRIWYVNKKFKQARWIHIVRDGRDCYRSAKKHPHIPQAKSVYNFSNYWKKIVKQYESIISEDRKHTVRYEDLTYAPEDVVENIMDFVGLSYDPSQIKPSVRKRFESEDGAGGSHSRLSDPISARSVGRWRDELTRIEIDEFHRNAGNLLREFGYLEDCDSYHD